MTWSQIINQLNSEIARHEKLSEMCRDETIAAGHVESAESLLLARWVIKAFAEGAG